MTIRVIRQQKLPSTKRRFHASRRYGFERCLSWFFRASSRTKLCGRTIYYPPVAQLFMLGSSSASPPNYPVYAERPRVANKWVRSCERRLAQSSVLCGIAEVCVKDVFRRGLRRQPGVRKEPQWRKSDELARFRRDGDAEVGKHRLASGRSIQINNRRHESPCRCFAHDVHVQREGISPVGEITLQS